MYSFAVFRGVFLMRPSGGLVIGYVGDRHGRKRSLVRRLFLMAVPNFLMGCLPTYAQVGSWSTVLPVLCRLLQGESPPCRVFPSRGWVVSSSLARR